MHHDHVGAGVDLVMRPLTYPGRRDQPLRHHLAHHLDEVLIVGVVVVVGDDEV
ncbi:hypothetical protein D3C86_2141970 [compost metagenome]